MKALGSNISILQSRLSEANGFLVESQELLSKEPGNFTAKISTKSWEAHCNDLKMQIRQSKERLAFESFGLRLFGGAMDGSLPLHMLVKITDHIDKAISHAAFYLRYGHYPSKGVPKKIKDEIDVRLSGLAFGSTKMSFAGKLQPDLSGESLLENTLEEIFNLLQSQDEESIRESVSNIGIRAINEISDLLNVFDSEQVGAEIKWPRSIGIESNWGGSLTAVQATKARLSSVSKLAPQIIDVVGTVNELKASGSIKILRSGESSSIRIEYKEKQSEFIDTLRLHQSISIKATEIGYVDEITSQEKFKYRLISPEELN